MGGFGWEWSPQAFACADRGGVILVAFLEQLPRQLLARKVSDLLPPLRLPVGVHKNDTEFLSARFLLSLFVYLVRFSPRFDHFVQRDYRFGL